MPWDSPKKKCPLAPLRTNLASYAHLHQVLSQQILNTLNSISHIAVQLLDWTIIELKQNYAEK